MQPLEKHGKTICFKSNMVVRRMLTLCRERGIGLNEILLPEHPREDVEQFFQLLGYSLDGYEELSVISNESVAAARRRAARLAKGQP